MYKASKRSKENLKGVDSRLVLLVGYAYTEKRKVSVMG